MCVSAASGGACAGAEVGGQQPVERTGLALSVVLEQVQEGCELTLAEIQMSYGFRHRQIRFLEALGDSSGIVARPPWELS